MILRKYALLSCAAALMVVLAACGDDDQTVETEAPDDETVDDDEPGAAPDDTDEGEVEPEGDEDFPTEAIELVIPYGAGGSIDTTARTFAEEFSEALGASVQVTNLPGGASTIGTAEVAGSEPDGYTLLITGMSAFSTTPQLQDTTYSPDDFVSIEGLTNAGYTILTTEDRGVTSFDDIANEDGRITYTTFGVGNVTHFAMANVLDELGVEGQGVPYDSAPDAIQAVRAGEADYGVISNTVAVPQILDGDVVGLAVVGDSALAATPDIPGLGELGFETAAGYIQALALLAPSDVDPDRVEILREAANEALESEAFQEYMESNHMTRSPHSGEAWLDDYVARMAEFAQDDFARLGLDD